MSASSVGNATLPAKVRREPLPPRLSMDDYARFVSDSLSRITPEKVARQKALEEQITTPFRLHRNPDDETCL